MVVCVGSPPPTTLSLARPPAHTARTTHPQMTRWMGVHRAHRPLPEEHRPLPRGDGRGGHHTHTHRLSHTLHITLHYNTSCYITSHYITLLNNFTHNTPLLDKMGWGHRTAHPTHRVGGGVHCTHHPTTQRRWAGDHNTHTTYTTQEKMGGTPHYITLY